MTKQFSQRREGDTGLGSISHSSQRDMLEAAIAEGRIELRYQPQITCASGEVVGVEALSRFKNLSGVWRDTQQTVLDLEATGQIHLLDFYVFEQVCAQSSRDRTWSRTSVNFSKHTILRPDFIERLTAIRNNYAPAIGTVQLEVTETALQVNLDALLHQLEQLEPLGLTVSLDDFGTCGTPLSMLTSPIIGEVKLDKSLADTLPSNPSIRRLMELIARFCHETGRFTVVEGVDSAEKLRIVRDLDFDAAQGYYIARPLTYEECLTFCSASPLCERTVLSKSCVLAALQGEIKP